MLIKNLTLREKPIHTVIRRNKGIFSSDINKRYNLFTERYVDPKLPENERLPIESFYPTQNFHDAINELAVKIPSDFSATGNEDDFLRKALIEGSYLKNMLHKIYVEGLMTINTYVILAPKISNDGSGMVVLDVEVVPSENVWAVNDEATTDLIKASVQERLVTYDRFDQPVHYTRTREYTMDTIKTTYSVKDVVTDDDVRAELEDREVENPYKEYGMLPILEFKGFSENNEPFANKIVEAQFQLDNLNTNIENIINMHSSPIYTIEGTTRNWQGIPIGAGTVLELRDKEKLSSISVDMQLLDLKSHFSDKVDGLYRDVGLTPPTLRQRMYGTDSSKVVKIADGTFIGLARIITQFAKKSLLKMVKLILLLNGRQFTNESLIPPMEILPYDLESILNTVAIGMNLGVMDAEWFWARYMPELTQEHKDRIKSNFDANQELSMANTNTTNIAKQTTPAGNKKTASMSAEERDSTATSNK